MSIERELDALRGDVRNTRLKLRREEAQLDKYERAFNEAEADLSRKRKDVEKLKEEISDAENAFKRLQAELKSDIEKQHSARSLPSS
ncbi:MAG: hypothetical protein ISR99_00615 [Parcubacteria group bacterium]|nr:hypothetical protein [Parcubacteria group bacterium]